MSGTDRVMAATKSAVRAVLPDRLYGPIRARRVRRLIDGYPSRTVQHRYAGFPLTVHLRDPLAEAWYDHDSPEPAEITRLRQGRLGAGSRVFDVGAHQGVVALMLARLVGPDGHVVAVEAEPHNAAVARANMAANDAANVTVLHAAGAAQPGRVSFRESLNGVLAAGGAPGAVEVEAVTIDGLSDRFGAPDVVLIDVEGYESHVLDGAGRTIAAGATDFFVELHGAGDLNGAGSTAQDVLGHFTPTAYEVAVALAHDWGGDLEWRDVASGVHERGDRCFVVARPRPATG